jgi:hypothetical protein
LKIVNKELVSFLKVVKKAPTPDKSAVIFAKRASSLNGFETPYSLRVFASNQELLFPIAFFLMMISKHIPINAPFGKHLRTGFVWLCHIGAHGSERHTVVHCFALSTFSEIRYRIRPQ